MIIFFFRFRTKKMIKLLQKRSEVLELNFLLCKEIVLFHQMLNLLTLLVNRISQRVTSILYKINSPLISYKILTNFIIACVPKKSKTIWSVWIHGCKSKAKEHFYCCSWSHCHRGVAINENGLYLWKISIIFPHTQIK
jgi:hypothetical protein